MRGSVVLACLVTALLAAAGCGGGGAPAEPAAVVESWSQAVTAGDAEAAGKLFADGAEVVQDGQKKTLESQEQAVAWNAALPCGWKVVDTTVAGDDVRGTFTLTRRPGQMCDDPGAPRNATISVVDGKITLFHELPSDAQPA